MDNCSGLDLLVVEVFTETPKLETAAEICLSEAERGLKVGFAFLDVDNFDDSGLREMNAPLSQAARRRIRLKRVKTVEKLLESRGVTVISVGAPHRGVEISLEDEGIDDIASLRRFRKHGAALGIGVLSSLIRYTGDTDPDFSESRPVVQRLLTAAYQAQLLTSSLIDRLNPTAVVVCNGRFACVKGIWEAARISGVEVRFHEIGGTVDRYSYSSSSPHCLRSEREELRRMWTRAGSGREEVGASFFRPGRDGAIMWESRYLDQQHRDVLPSADGRRRIVFFTSSIDEFAAVEDEVEHPVFESQFHGAQWLASWVRTRSDTELIIRIHPRMRRLSAREWDRWKSLGGFNVSILPAASAVDSYSLAQTADRIVCYHSSMGAEATYLGKASILVGDATYRGLDCVYEPQTLEEFEWMLEAPELPPKARANCLPFGYYRLMNGSKFRFHEPNSLSGGSILGRRLIPLRGTILDRILVKALRISDRVVSCPDGQCNVRRGLVRFREPSF